MRGLSADHGNVVIIVALMMTTLLGVGALAVDVGALYVRRQQVQTGADAAALAIAKQCVDFVAAGQAWKCDKAGAEATAAAYFDGNVPVTVDMSDADPVTADATRVGRITVGATVDEPRLLSWAINPDEPPDAIAVGADATARWGPVTAMEGVFPLAVCKGALPAVGDSVTLWSSTTGTELTGECDDAPTALPFGWTSPSTGCTSDVTLLPPDPLSIAPSDAPPVDPACGDAISELLDELTPGTRCYALPGGGSQCQTFAERSERRTRVLALYDASLGSVGVHPIHALIALEFTGARIGVREEHGPQDWTGVCDPTDTTYAMDELQCIRGTVVHYDPPADSPIIDLGQISLPSIKDSTVLDVRLVD